MISLTGAKTGSKIAIPKENVGMILEMQSKTFIDTGVPGEVEHYKTYPKKFTRVFLKQSASKMQFADCIESPEEVIKLAQ